MYIKGIKFTDGGTSVTFKNPNQISLHFGSDNKWKKVRLEESSLSLIFSQNIVPFELEEQIGKNTLDLIVKHWDVIKEE